jgi:hypothetical protein
MPTTNPHKRRVALVFGSAVVNPEKERHATSGGDGVPTKTPAIRKEPFDEKCTPRA